MGVFDSLRNIFSKKAKEPQADGSVVREESISIPNLESWFAAKEADIIKNAELVIREKSPKIQEQIKNCEIALVALKTAEPRYPQLYNQAKNVADGNRLAFSTSTENFLKSIKLPNSPSLLHDFIQAFELNMNNFMAVSNRSFVISNEFFTEQAGSVKTNLQTIDKLMQEIKTHCRHNKLADLKKAKEDITKLVKKIQQSQQLKDELKEVDAKLTELLKQKDSIRMEQSAFLQSAEFLEKQNLEKELKETQVQIKAKEDELYSTFGTLDTPLRKLAWENPKLKKHINNYLNNLVGAVSEDKDFSFRETLVKLRLAIEAGEVDLKDKKRAQAIKDVNQLTDSFIQIWRSLHKGLKEKAVEIQGKLENSVVARKELELKAQLQLLETEQEALNRQKGILVTKINKTNLDKEIEELSNKLSALLGYAIKISNG
jgi:uncharacterized membrane-anchored protein YhcB (DUF1043 family)